MVWATAGENTPSLSFEAFLDLAKHEGIEMGDEKHLKLLYEDTVGLLSSMAKLVTIDADHTDPSDVYIAGSEVR